MRKCAVYGVGVGEKKEISVKISDHVVCSVVLEPQGFGDWVDSGFEIALIYDIDKCIVLSSFDIKDSIFCV